MRVPRVRFTVRRMMVAVAVVALVLGGVLRALDLARRSAEYRRKATEAEKHEKRLVSYSKRYPERAKRLRALSGDWASVKEKYHRAARYPWLPVAPDPPEPE